ncbi:ROK family protein [Streptomyces sp. NPDC005925]|uniref:ROK family protein n=1 Tax=Streptomyces sp. NPDC005925 TaxID=3157172 RepID=UPI0033CFA63F
MAEHHPTASPAVLALDIGGTKLAAGVVAADGTVLSSAVCPTRAPEGPDQALKRLIDLGRQAVASAGADLGGLIGTGIGCGGPLDPYTGVLTGPPHLPGWVDVPITELARAAYGHDAVLDNDGTAGAAGQWRFGAGRGSDHVVYLTLSTGVGGGAVFEGRTFRGAAGNGGEPGHVTVRSGGRRCRSCERAGCLEAYASGTSIAERAREGLAEGAGGDSALNALEDVTAADVTAAVRAGDPFATALWEETLDLLGSGLTSIVNLYEPEVLVLGGGVTRAADLLFEPVRRRVAAQAMGPAAAAVRIVPATGGEHAGLLGAAAVAFERLT